MVKETEYENLKDSFKVKYHSWELFDYLLHTNKFNPNKPFHSLTKDELIEEYKKTTEKHLKLLQEL